MPRTKKPASKKAKQAKVHKVMSEYKDGDLKSSSGDKVKSRRQAIAIAMSESGQSKKEGNMRHPGSRGEHGHKDAGRSERAH